MKKLQNILERKETEPVNCFLMLLGKHLHNCNCARKGIEGNGGECKQVGKKTSADSTNHQLQLKMHRTTVHLDFGCIIEGTGCTTCAIVRHAALKRSQLMFLCRSQKWSTFCNCLLCIIYHVASFPVGTARWAQLNQ